MDNERLAGILEQVKNLTIIELLDLVKMMEEDYSFSEDAMALAAPAAGGAPLLKKRKRQNLTSS